ncbi:exonuclease domain-containing protein [Candidatus Mycobacterium wuenschmannii]|uniref:Exonuclease domain-containing protein n=1 Tax=Candidatus Mycobacterium wuenschmannii TaxID=3027808 RepID=A0ABY8VWP9_9MYCO|nr:exonuclease domain-containing protein [Candidatus Mycobacterium wuenschmannii]WIM88069.1 exonuclease domain-containing protein [Candidatus Mycobacterium wuenschmannii]
MSAAAGWYSDPWSQATLRWCDGIRWTKWTYGSEPPIAPGNATQPGRGLQDSTAGSESGLSALLSDADRIAVIDVETTGLFSADRVVEVAVVSLDRNGSVVDEFECLINPLRDPGPTWIHGLTPSILQGAPAFDDIALHLAALIDGAVVAAHNLCFDRRLLGYEFDRLGIDVDWGDGLDTLRAVGGCKLSAACMDYGVQLHGAHRALTDARATTELLLKVVDFFRSCRPASARPVSASFPRVLTRDGLTAVDVERPYVTRLAANLHSSADFAPYVTLLDYAVADLRFDADERRELSQLAEDLGLNERGRAQAHREFLQGVIDAALDDGAVTDDEFDQLCRTAALLQLDDAVVYARTNPYRITTEALHLHPGMRICFTGAALRPNGDPLERDDLETHARQHDLEPVSAVTKKNCDLLVAADPASMSRKAKDAKKFGIPIASVSDYLTALRTRSPLLANRLPAKGVGLVCSICGHTWIAARRRGEPVCDGCRQPAKPSSGPNDGQNATNTNTRADRLDRCREAVDLQQKGLSRRDIGATIGVSDDTVKGLLRDGKFYADPTTDPTRLDLAKLAAAARSEGVPRAVFCDQARLSKGKADEVWKDADVLFSESNATRHLGRVVDETS